MQAGGAGRKAGILVWQWETPWAAYAQWTAPFKMEFPSARSVSIHWVEGTYEVTADVLARW